MTDFNAMDLLTDDQRGRDPSWLVQGYAAAFARIVETHPSSDGDPPRPWGPHWESEDDMTTPGDATVYAWSGAERTPDEARRRAFELLAHADIAEAQASRPNWAEEIRQMRRERDAELRDTEQ